MTTFYRTPNIIVDAHEWHVIVWSINRSKPTIVYRWRPVSEKTRQWYTVDKWVGPRPFELWRYFAKYRSHIKEALLCEDRRRQTAAAIAARRTPPTFAMKSNQGRRYVPTVPV